MNTERRISTLKETLSQRPLEHGKRATYITVCRCLQCRAANSRYSCERAAAQQEGDCRGLVPADKTRQHLQALSKKGVGYKSVAEAAGVSKTILARVIWGKRLHVRANTERAVLAITAEAVADEGYFDRLQLVLHQCRDGLLRAMLRSARRGIHLGDA